MRAKSTPGTRSSLGVSRIATQADEDKCHTWMKINFLYPEMNVVEEKVSKSFAEYRIQFKASRILTMKTIIRF